jgi:hypothetical protein
MTDAETNGPKGKERKGKCNGLVWQRHAMDRVVLKYYSFILFFIFSYFSITINFKTIIFYYYSNKKIHYNTKFFHFSI